MMQRLMPDLLAGAFLAVFLFGLIGVPIAVTMIQRRRDRRRILAEGTTASALITRLTPASASGTARVYFRFLPETGNPPVECRQNSTVAAIQALALREGSEVRIHYLPKWPRYAFIDTLVVAERLAGVSPAPVAADLGAMSPSVHFISYVDPARQTAAANAFRWSGDGDITIVGDVVRFTADRARPFLFPKKVGEEFALNAVSNVEVYESALRLEIAKPSGKPRTLEFWAVSAEDAKAIAAQLPATRSPTFAPALAEQAAFRARLLEVTPRAPVTPVIIGINVVMFLIAAVYGGGVFVPNAEVMIRLGSDYTPLTVHGEWWRLLTSTFLHFGILHLAFNMWALWVNGIPTERLYGSSRFLLLYLVAGVSGSVASFLWHPIVNGAGASGAIFGVLGALLAYFSRSDGSVPRSVLVSQRKTAAIFIVVSILNAARVRGIDNAAHLGGLAAGFVMGWLLWRPLEPQRAEQDWTGQWARALGVVAVFALLGGHYLRSGEWHPRVLHDPSGRAIKLAELVPLPHTIAGVTLGMTADEVRRSKGKARLEHPGHWVYDSIDPAHDGLVEAYFTDGPNGEAATVWAVLFFGKQAAEPPGLPDLLGFSREDLVFRYGKPLGETRDPQTTFLFFNNGLMAGLVSGKVNTYGVYAPRASKQDAEGK